MAGNREEVDITLSLEEAALLSLERIKSYLELPCETRKNDEYLISLDKANVGKTIISNYVRILSTSRAREAMQLTVCELLAMNKEQLDGYIKTALPQLHLGLQLNRLKDANDRDVKEKEKYLKDSSKRDWEAKEGIIKSHTVK